MIKKIRLLHMTVGALFFSTSMIIAQNNVFYNKGILQVKSKTILSSYSDFANHTQGRLINDGLTYYFGDFSNDGDFSYTKTLNTGEVKFVSMKQQNTVISGNKTVDFNKVTFDLNKDQYYFDLKANLDIWGEAYFKKGIVKVDSGINTTSKAVTGLVSFMPKAKSINSSAISFVDGTVEKVGGEPFVFPVGNQQYYRPASISTLKDDKDIVLCNYRVNDSTFFEAHQEHVREIKQVNTKEYWKIEKSKNKQTSLILTLSWDEETTPPDLLQDPAKDLHIIYWNETNKQWEDLGGIVDMENKTIATPAQVSNFGYFTLGRVQQVDPMDDEVVIYNYVNANGGDNNDYFVIKNINKYPQNSVQIYNRWGAKVYETKNYDSQGNVFRGYQTKGGKLPAGTYYYLITYKKETKNNSYTVKKTGYLHLDAK